MASVLLKACTACHEYTLRETCPRCGAPAKPNRPAKFSPEDTYGGYRRKLKRLDATRTAAGGAGHPPAAPDAPKAPAAAASPASAAVRKGA